MKIKRKQLGRIFSLRIRLSITQLNFEQESTQETLDLILVLFKYYNKFESLSISYKPQIIFHDFMNFSPIFNVFMLVCYAQS